MFKMHDECVLISVNAGMKKSFFFLVCACLNKAWQTIFAYTGHAREHVCTRLLIHQDRTGCTHVTIFLKPESEYFLQQNLFATRWRADCSWWPSAGFLHFFGGEHRLSSPVLSLRHRPAWEHCERSVRLTKEQSSLRTGVYNAGTRKNKWHFSGLGEGFCLMVE